MITNTGKNIIAKYLIGDATSYASYLALGCGQKPRPKVTTLSGVQSFSFSGTIDTTAQTTTISGIDSTRGLAAGMSLLKISGTGFFGGEDQTATILSVNSETEVAIETDGLNTVGSISFYSFGLSGVLEVESTAALWTGASLSIISSASGFFSSLEPTLISKILDDTKIVVSPLPNRITDAELKIGVDPNKNALDFEMFRVPISSRGYINDNGVNKIIFTAQLPSEERYEITEIGIYSAGSNSLAGIYDSKTLTAFSGAEPWELNTGDSLTGAGLNNAAFPEFEVSIINTTNNITTNARAIKATSTNGIFSNPVRLARYERPRYLNGVYMLRGGSSYISKTNDQLSIGPNPTFLQYVGETFDLSQNSSSDLIKMTFSIVAVNGASLDVPENVRIVAEFSNPDGSQYARMNIDASNDDFRFTDNRYVLISQRLSDLSYTPQFSWRTVDSLKIYVSAIQTLTATNKEVVDGVATIKTFTDHNFRVGDAIQVSGVDGLNGIHTVTATPTQDTFSFETAANNAILQEIIPTGTVEAGSDDYFIALDAIRLDNISTANPLYGLVGYSIIQDENERAIVKAPNTTNFVEYRFALDVI
jgi:hypothetical protein